MKPLNLRVILLLGGILLITLGFQIFQRNSIENFSTAATTATPPAATTLNTPTSTTVPDLTGTPSITLPANTNSSGVSYYDIPFGNNQIIKLSIPVQPPSMVHIPAGPVPSSLPPIE